MKENKPDEFFQDLQQKEEHEDDKKKLKLQRVQTALDSNFELNVLKKISAVKKRRSLISKEVEV